MLDIKSLSASVDGKKILEGFDLKIKSGEVHAIMGPNGSGKSTLANVLTGKNGYEIEGQVLYQGKDLLNLPIEERAQKGLFMAFQYPLEIAGVNTNNFLKISFFFFSPPEKPTFNCLLSIFSSILRFFVFILTNFKKPKESNSF